MRSKRSIRRAQRGVSLPMIAIAVAVMALILVAVAQQRVRAANELAGRSLGSVLNELGSAVELYRTSNLAVLTGPGPVAVTGFVDPYAPTTTELAAVGILSAPLNLPAADYQIRLQRSPLGCTAPADDPCTVWAQTSLTNPILEPDGTLSATRLSSLVGRITTASASFSGPPNPAIIVGGSGSWTVANPDPGARNGIVMMVSGLGGGGRALAARRRYAQPEFPRSKCDRNAVRYTLENCWGRLCTPGCLRQCRKRDRVLQRGFLDAI